MRTLLFFFFFISLNISFSQKTISTQLIDSISLNADTFIGVDDFENYYYIKGNTFYKKTTRQTYSYTNTQLGNITSVNITNPLKILLLYRDFNTIVILDNRLNELTDIINFSRESYTKNVTFASISSNNNLWLYSLDDTILSLWNYETKQTIFDSQPLNFYNLNFEATALISDYENCWISSQKGIIQFNEFGSYLQTVSLIDSSYLKPYGNGFTYLKNKKLFTYENDISTEIEFVNNNHLSTNYFVNKNSLYFFTSDKLFKYSILKK